MSLRLETAELQEIIVPGIRPQCLEKGSIPSVGINFAPSIGNCFIKLRNFLRTPQDVVKGTFSCSNPRLYTILALRWDREVFSLDKHPRRSDPDDLDHN